MLEFQEMPQGQEVSVDSRDQGWLIWPMKRMVPEETGEKRHTILWLAFVNVDKYCHPSFVCRWICSCFGSTTSLDEKLCSVPVGLCLMRKRKGLSTVTQGGEERAIKMAAKDKSKHVS